jgi:glycosyltransferase involved in cell wall biosynthesis
MLDVCPFLSSSQFKLLYTRGGLPSKALMMLSPVLKRLMAVSSVGRFDLIYVQREAMFFGPGIFEWLYSRVGRIPMVLDLDDATYVRYESPIYGRLGSSLKFFGKTDKLIERSKIVTCGNSFIAEYVRSKGKPAVVVPTVVDLEAFCPKDSRERSSDIKIGWIGTHSTFPFLESVFPVLQRLAENHRFVLKVVGSGRDEVRVKGVDVENLDWSLESEVEDFRSLDIGLYPITVSSAASPEWIRGKSGFKAIQYMAVGVPFVMSPVGVNGELGIPGTTHFNATSDQDWYNSLDTLLCSEEERRRMGLAGREFALTNYSLSQHADVLAETLVRVVDDACKRGQFNVKS